VSRVYGHEATVRRYVPHSADADGRNPREEEIKIHRKGPESVVRRAARLTSGFVEVVRVEAFTEQQWLATFGRGRM
jgi:hypothetical protein